MLLLFFLMENKFFFIYYDHSFPSFISFQVLLTSPPFQIKAFSLKTNKEKKRKRKKKKKTSKQCTRNTCRDVHKQYHKNTKSKTIICKQKTNKVKKCNMRQKPSNNTYEVFLCCPSADHGACLYVLFAYSMKQGETNFSFESSCQVEITSGLGMDAYVYFPILALGLPLFWTCTWCHS